MSAVKKYQGQVAKIVDHPMYAKALYDSTVEAVNVQVCYRYTDRQLVMRINEFMHKRGLRVKAKTWEHWRNAYTNDEEWVFENEYLFKAFAYVEKAMLEAMDFLVEKLETERSWQRYAWLLERKFDQWKLSTDVNVKGEVNHNVQLVLNMPKDVPIITDENTMEAKYDLIN
jgi:hypothetical protein